VRRNDAPKRVVVRVHDSSSCRREKRTQVACLIVRIMTVGRVPRTEEEPGRRLIPAMKDRSALVGSATIGIL
jgi:hypothetical protein